MAIRSQNETLNKVGEAEEMFVLRGRDASAPQTICLWIAANIINDGCPDAKLEEALACALRMRQAEGRRAAD